jgi:transposase
MDEPITSGLCPRCGRTTPFTPATDEATGELLPDLWRCDQCGATSPIDEIGVRVLESPI